MSDKQLKIVFWIAFTALFFIVFCGVSYLLSGSPDLPMAIVFFIIIGLLDKQDIGYLVDHYSSKIKDKSK